MPRSKPLTYLINAFWSAIVCTLIGGFVYAAYMARISLWKSSYITIGLYGCVLVAHYTLQIVFALLNRRRTNQKRANRWNDWVGVSTGVLIVGYREDEDLFRKCLLSVRKQNYGNKAGVIVVVDGNDEEDRYMGDIFSQVFCDVNPILIEIQFVLAETADILDDTVQDFRMRMAEALKQNRPICILQPHRGKRVSMYTGMSLFIDHDVEAIMVTDSDTELAYDATKELAATLIDTNVGAACGEVLIWNHADSVIAFLSSLRYYSAFNIERACSSFFGCVACVSGPLGIYRKAALQPIMQNWVNQYFLGALCTYGDDRHLTNLVLSQSYRVVYTHLATCKTETPSNYFRWLTQQTRWSKSFYREQLITATFFWKQSFWMSYELVFNMVYPFVSLFSIMYIFFHQSTMNMIVMFIIIFASGFIRGILLSIVSRDWVYLMYPMYGFMYVFGLLAAKFQALILLWDTAWGTTSRKAGSISFHFHQTLFPVLWIVLIMAGVVYNGVTNKFTHKEKWSTAESISIALLGGMIVFWIASYHMIKMMRKT